MSLQQSTLPVNLSVGLPPPPPAAHREKPAEDTLCKKLFTLLPVIGGFAQALFEHNIRVKINESTNPEEKVGLLRLKNQFKAIGIAKAVLTAAIIATLIGLSILSGGILPAIGLGLLGICVIIDLTNIYRNQRSMEKARNNQPFNVY